MEKTDAQAFAILMETLSTTFSIELTELRFQTYWGALKDLPLEAVQWACQAIVQQEPHFPVPLTVREYAKQYREAQVQRAAQEARALLPTWSTLPDEEGVKAIRKILVMLGDSMAMTHPVYQQPSTDDPDKRRAELLEQARLVMRHETSEENPYADRH